MSLSAAKQLTCWLQICPCPGSNTYCHLLLMKLRDVVWCKWRVSFCHSCHSSPCCNELSDWVRILPFARAWHAICWACSCTWAKAGVAGGGGPGPLTQTWLSAVSATGCSSNAGVGAMSLPCLQGEGGWGRSDQKGWVLCSSESCILTRSLLLSSGLCLSTLRADSCWTGSCGEETGGKQKHFN